MRLRIRKRLVYYKEVNDPKLEDQNYLSTVASFKKKISIAKIRTNSYEFHGETGRWIRCKTSWEERICKVCNSIKVENENIFS
jgi:hypothetical protein